MAIIPSFASPLRFHADGSVLNMKFSLPEMSQCQAGAALLSIEVNSQSLTRLPAY
jgi:hypothetical protein